MASDRFGAFLSSLDVPVRRALEELRRRIAENAENKVAKAGDTMTGQLRVIGGSDVTNADGSGFIQVGASGGSNMGIDSNEIQVRNSGTPTILSVQGEGGGLNVGPAGGSTAAINLRGPVTITTTDNGKLTLREAEAADTTRIGFVNQGGTEKALIASDGANAFIIRNQLAQEIVYLQATDIGGTVRTSLECYADGAGNGRMRSLGTYNSTAAATANVGITSAGLYFRTTSSGRFKTDVEDLDDEHADLILKLRPVYYRSIATDDVNGPHPEWTYYGLIAEEVADVDPRLVHWGESEDGDLIADGVQYDRLVPHLISVIQRLEARVAELEAPRGSES